MNLKEALEDLLPAEDIEKVGRAFEQVGTIAIVELPDISSAKKKIVADVLMKLHKNVKTVVEKVEDVSGSYRLPKFSIISGEDTTETIHKENGCVFAVDLNTAYFSSKLGSERLRVAELAKPKENILCLFAGVGPFAITCAKKQKTVQMTTVEINPAAVASAKKNAILNKVADRMTILQGDVKEILPTIKGKFNRILMPAPKNAEEFLADTLKKVTKKGFVHLYTFAPVEEVPSVGERIKAKAEELGYKIKVLLVRKCGDVGAYNHRVVVDFQVEGLVPRSRGRRSASPKSP